MAFDWNDYLTFAQELKSRGDEAAVRSAISRAYYCVFHCAKDYAIANLGYLFRSDQPSHVQMWKLFEGKGRTFKAVHDKGMALKRIRQDADYESDVTPVTVDHALRLAGDALTYLRQLSN